MFRPGSSAWNSRRALDVGQVRLGQVRRAPEQLRDRAGERLDRLLARVAGGDLLAHGVGLEALVPAVGELAGESAAELRGEVREVAAICRKLLLPRLDERLAGRDRLAEERGRLVGDVEVTVRIPAVGLLDEPDLVGAERLAVCLLRVLAVRAAEADVGLDGDDRRPRVLAGGLDRTRDRLDVVAVLDALGVPRIGGEPGEDILGPGHLRRPIELDAVVVVEGNELAEPEVPRERSRLGRDPLLEVPVGAERVGPVVDDVVAGPVELEGQPTLGDRHADGIREALAERPGRRLDARRQPELGMARGLRAPLTERLEVVERHVVAGQMKERVEEHRGVPGRKDEAVAIGPVGARRRVAEEPCPERVRHRCGAHGRARVP